MGLFRQKYKLKINVPSSIEIKYFENKVKFVGAKSEILVFSEEIRKVSKLKDGQLCKLDKLTLKVSDFITPDQDRKLWVELPGHAWNIMASKFQDALEGFDTNPFYFNDCGYLDRIPLDIGIEITDLPPTEN